MSGASREQEGRSVGVLRKSSVSQMELWTGTGTPWSKCGVGPMRASGVRPSGRARGSTFLPCPLATGSTTCWGRALQVHTAPDGCWSRGRWGGRWRSSCPRAEPGQVRRPPDPAEEGGEEDALLNGRGSKETFLRTQSAHLGELIMRKGRETRNKACIGCTRTSAPSVHGRH